MSNFRSWDTPHGTRVLQGLESRAGDLGPADGFRVLEAVEKLGDPELRGLAVALASHLVG